MTWLLNEDRISSGERLNQLIAAGCTKALTAGFASTPEESGGASTDAWYAVSYKPILVLFDQTRSIDAENPTALQTAWAQRKAMVASWLRGIPKTGLDRAAAGRLLRCELTLVGATLADDAFPEIDATIQRVDPGFPLRHLLGEANCVLNRTKTVRLASSTKLLHFMLPELVPIIDTNVSQNLFGEETPSLGRYLEYVGLLRAYLREGEHREVLFELARQHGVSPVRLVDSFLFRREAEDELEDW